MLSLVWKGWVILVCTCFLSHYPERYLFILNSPNETQICNWQPYESRRASPNVTFIRESQTEIKSSKQTLQKTCHVRVYAFSTHPMNSLHMPLSNPTINSTVLIDKIPQQNKTDRVIFVQPGKIVFTSTFFYLQTVAKMIKTRIFVLFFFFRRRKHKHSIFSSAASFCISSHGKWLPVIFGFACPLN